MIQKLPIDDLVALTLLDALKLESVFPGFNGENARKIFAHSGLYLYPKDSVVVGEGDTGRDLYVLYKGNLDVVQKENGKTKSIGKLEEGEIFGEMGLLGDGVRSATVIAKKDSEIFRLAYEDVEDLLVSHKKLGEHLERIIRERFNV